MPQREIGVVSRMRRLLKWLFVLSLALVVVLGGLLWRLSQGPLSLTPLQPLLQTLVDRGAPYRVSFTNPSLVWFRDKGTIALEIRDVEARSETGAFVASAPLLRGQVAVRPLLLGRLELVAAQLELPGIELTRNADGKLVLSFGGKLADVVFGEEGSDEGLDKLMGGASESADPRVSHLRLVQVTAPSLQFVDAVSGDRASANDPVFELEQKQGIWTASLSGRLGEGHVEASTEPATPSPLEQVTIEFQQLQARDFAAFAPDLPLAGIAVPISGTVGFTFNPTTGERGSATVDLSAGAGEIGVASLGLAPIPITGGSFRGRLAAGWLTGEIERCELAAPGYSLNLAGTLGLAEHGVDADLTLKAGDLDVAEILQLWPKSLGGDARDWVVANVPVGKVSAATFQLSSHGDRPNQPKIGGQFSFNGMQLRYIDTMPPATGLEGAGSLAGNSLQFKVDTAQTGGVSLASGDVVLSNLFVDPPVQLHLKADLQSTLPDAMTLLDNEPVALGKSTGLSAANATGQQTTKLEIGLPLLDEIPPEKIRYKATTQLRDTNIRQVAPGYDLAAGSVMLVAEPTGISAQGDVRVNGVPATVEVRENTPPVRGVTRTVKAIGSLDAAGAKSLAVTWPTEIGGSVGFDVRLVEARSPLRTIDVDLDLQQATFGLEPVVLMKRRGEPGRLTARLVQADAHSLSVQKAQVDAAGWQVEGDADLQLDPPRPQRVELRRLIGPLGDLTANLTLDGTRWRGRVDVGRLDLRPVLHGGGGSAGGDTPALPDFRVDVTARQLRIGDAPISNLDGSVERRRGIWAVARLRANIEDSQISLDAATPAQRTVVTLIGSDAGWLLRGIGTSDNGIRGGRFQLSADVNQASSGLNGSGELKVREFTLWGAPLIARIISLASFSGLGHALSGQGVPVQRLVAPFHIQGQRITLEGARLVGSDIGARADGVIDLGTQILAINGTVAPAYTINRILGRIPIIGQIMSGRGSDAALAATFSVSGPIAQPQVSVNPLSALVPGMIRDLFGALTADTSGSSSRIDER